MSGGAWGYQQFRIREALDLPKRILDFVAEVEHELDWGVSSDSCSDCARINVADAFIAFFEKEFGDDTDDPLEVLRRRSCPACVDREKKRGRMVSVPMWVQRLIQEVRR